MIKIIIIWLNSNYYKVCVYLVVKDVCEFKSHLWKSIVFTLFGSLSIFLVVLAFFSFFVVLFSRGATHWLVDFENFEEDSEYFVALILSLVRSNIVVAFFYDFVLELVHEFKFALIVVAQDKNALMIKCFVRSLADKRSEGLWMQFSF